MKIQKMPNNLTTDDVLEAVERDDCTGFCLSCGAERDACEPDARNYWCENCGEQMVFGAAEIMFMLVA